MNLDHRVGTIPAAIILAAGCSMMNSLPAGRVVDGIAPADYTVSSLAVGKEKDVQWRRAEGLGLVPAPQLQTYLDGLAQRLQAHSPVRNTPADAYIRASQEFNAAATPDANIFINLGTLRALDSEDQVAFVVAHELSHIILGHNDSDLVARTQEAAIALTEIGMLVADEVTEGKAGRTVGKKGQLGKQRDALLANTIVISPAWTRTQEREADLLGTDLIVKAGYSPDAAIDVLTKIEEAAKASKGVTLEGLVEDLGKAGWFTPATYQAKNEAAQPLQKDDEDPAALNIPFLGDTASKAFDNLGAFGDSTKRTAGYAWEHAVGWMKQNHPSPAERKQDLSAYIEREYATAGKPQNIDAWEDAITEAEIGEIIERYDLAYDAYAAMENGSKDEALELARASVSGLTANHAYPRFHFSLIREDENDLRNALRNAELAYDSAEPALCVYRRASKLLEKSGKHDDAIRILEEGRVRFAEPPSVLPDLIALYRRAGRKEDVERLLLKCKASHPHYTDACTKAATGQWEGETEG